MEDVTIEKNLPSSFALLRNFFNWSYENPSKINPNVTAIYVFILDHQSRLGFKREFGLPTMMTMEAVGIKNYRTYKKALDILVEYNFIEVVEWSKNQYSSNIIALVKNTKANTKALTKASTKHGQKHSESTASIDKLKNLRTKEYIDDDFEIIWSNYGRIGSKKKALQIWENLDEPTRDKISKSIPGYLDHIKKTGYSPKHFTSYLNSDEYENYLNFSTLSSGEIKVEQIKILPNLSNNFEFSLIHKLKGLNQQERWEYYRANRPECSEVFQYTRKYQGDDYDSFCLLDRTHPLRKFTADYHNFVEYENNNV
jgi:hypothetical protein